MLSDEELAQRAEALLRIEEATAKRVGERLGSIVRRLLGLAVALWPGDEATMEEQQEMLSRLNVDSLQPAMAQVRQDIKAGAREALKHGLSVAREEAEAAGVSVPAVEDLPPRVRHVSPGVHARVDALETVARSKILKTKVLLKHSTTLDEVLESLAVASQIKSVSESVARTSTNEVSNEAITAVASTSDDLVSVWRAERDACLHCLAYQGQIDTGDGYPTGLTFDKKPLNTESVAAPPLHPNCRCSQSLVHKSTVKELADALKREAKRSVLRGWSVESESSAARIAAAKRLLEGGTSLPKSVQDYAKKAIKSGRFPRGRRPPV